MLYEISHEIYHGMKLHMKFHMKYIFMWSFMWNCYKISLQVSNVKWNVHIEIYRQTSNTSRTSVGDKTVDYADVVGASPVGTAPTTSSFSSWLQWIGQSQLQDEARNIYVLGLVRLILAVWRYISHEISCKI